ncbi:MAG: EAL domain-containing response regulator [Pseudomonadota bacterium]
MKNLLIIEDDPVFAGYMKELLAAAGVTDAVHLGDAQNAISSSIQFEAFDLICCDLNMPQMDGIEFIRELSKRKWPGELIIVSGEAESVVRTSARLAQMSGLNLRGSLRKPVKLPDLLELLNESPLGRKSTTSPANVISERKHQIEAAFESRSICPVYQPQLNLQTMDVDGFEALMRLKLQDGSFAVPGEFFSLITPDLEATIATEFIRKTVRDFSLLAVRGSINMSPSMLQHADVVTHLTGACEQYDVPPSSIVVEVTESEPMLDDPALISSMSRLRIAGFGLALDDFGTGHANIHELGWFPFSEIKTDLSFGQNMIEDGFARAAIEFAVRAAQQLEMQLTIEGVETVDAVTMAKEIGGERAQGYAIAKPLPFSWAKKLITA